MGLDAMIFIFWTLSFKPAFSLSSCTFIKRLFVFSLLSAIRVVSSTYLRLLIFLPTSHAPSLITIQNQPYCTGIQNDPLGSRCCFCDEPLTRVTPCWVVYGASDPKGLVQVWVPGLARPARIGSWYVNDLPRFLDELGKWLLGWGGWSSVLHCWITNHQAQWSGWWFISWARLVGLQLCLPFAGAGRSKMATPLLSLESRPGWGTTGVAGWASLSSWPAWAFSQYHHLKVASHGGCFQRGGNCQSLERLALELTHSITSSVFYWPSKWQGHTWFNQRGQTGEQQPACTGRKSW